MSKQWSLDEVCLEIGDVTFVWDDGKQVKAHKELEEVMEVVRVWRLVILLLSWMTENKLKLTKK